MIPETGENRKVKGDNDIGTPNTNGQKVALIVPNVAGLSLLDAALVYARAGWYVLPTDPTDIKNPGSVVGGNWHEKSSRDPKQIRKWWAENPDRGIVLHCGRSGAVVFDLDVSSLDILAVYGRADIAEALASAGAIQGTRHEGDRGHYIFLMPPDKQFGNGAGAFMICGEVRGKNGVIAVTPTPHPDADGDYRWIKTGVVTPLPDVLRACLTEAGDSAEPLTDAELNVFLNTHTGVGCGREGCRHTVSGAVKWFETEIAQGASRHDKMTATLPWAFSEAMAGCYPAREVFGTLYSTYVAKFDPETEHERVNQLGGEYLRIAKWAAALAQTDPDRAHRNDDLLTNAELEAFWSARPILRHIYTSSLAQQMDPRGVLAVHLVRAICSIPPHVTLPGITAARASLNLHAALVGPSSGGKSSSVAVAKQAIAVTPEPEMTTLGSGEGIAKQYAYRDGKTKAIVTVTNTLLFNDTEIESVEALAKRGGSSLMSQWRKTFTGEQLGFGFADPKHRIPVRAHKYRFCQTLGIQPELAEWLLTGGQAAGGTPQRILWAPVVYADMPRPEDLPEWPGQKVLPSWPALMPDDPDAEGFRVKWSTGGPAVDEPANEDLLHEHELKVPDEVEETVREARWKFHHGEVDDLSGHSTLTRLKVAAALMWLDARTDAIRMDDWELAGVVMKISDQTRADVLKVLSSTRKRTDQARGRSDAVREVAKAEALDEIVEKKIARVSEGIRKKLRDENHQSLRDLKKRFSAPDRKHVWPALEHLSAVGDVELEQIEYKGRMGHIAHLKERR